MTTVKLTMIKAVNVNQFRLFIVKNALQVSEIVIFIKPAHGCTGPLGFSQVAQFAPAYIHILHICSE